MKRPPIHLPDHMAEQLRSTFKKELERLKATSPQSTDPQVAMDERTAQWFTEATALADRLKQLLADLNQMDTQPTDPQAPRTPPTGPTLRN